MIYFLEPQKFFRHVYSVLLDFLAEFATGKTVLIFIFIFYLF